MEVTQTAQIVEDRDQLLEILHSIKMVGTRLEDWQFDWKGRDVVDGWLVQCSFERPDANNPDGGLSKGYGRHWYVEMGTPVTGVVFTAWMAIQQIIIHELHEAFTVEINGERVRLLDPHKELTDLAVGSRRV